MAVSQANVVVYEKVADFGKEGQPSLSVLSTEYVEVKPLGKLPARIKIVSNNVVVVKAERKKGE